MKVKVFCPTCQSSTTHVIEGPLCSCPCGLVRARCVECDQVWPVRFILNS